MKRGTTRRTTRKVFPPLTPDPSPARGEGRLEWRLLLFRRPAGEMGAILPSPLAGEGGERSEPGEGALGRHPHQRTPTTESLDSPSSPDVAIFCL